jgi:hypothetical protein
LYPTTVDVLAVQLSAAECATAVTPVPVKITVAGEPAALLVIVTAPVRFPAVPGANCTTTVTLCVGVSVTADPPLVIENPVPVAAIDDIATSPLPVSVMLKLLVVELPVFTLPKTKFVALNDSVRLAVVPVPVSGIVAGESGELLVTVSVPASAAAAVGANFTLKLVVAPAAKVIGIVATPLSLNPVPATVTCVIIRSAFPVFLSCTVCAFVVPSDTDPKLTLPGVALSCGVAVVGGVGVDFVLWPTTPAQPYCQTATRPSPTSNNGRLIANAFFCPRVILFIFFSLRIASIFEASHLAAWTQE